MIEEAGSCAVVELTPTLLAYRQYKGKTDATGVAREAQLDVYERTVHWSSVKQMRSVVECDFSTDEVFEHLISGVAGSGINAIQRLARKTGSESQRKGGSGRVLYPYSNVDKDVATCLRYAEVPFPWPFEPRDSYVVQDYVRFRSRGDSSSFVTYNHDVEHTYFKKRRGFVRAQVKYQGVVGESVHGKTRLTWLLNIDFRGLVPTAAVQGFLSTTMVGRSIHLNSRTNVLYDSRSPSPHSYPVVLPSHESARARRAERRAAWRGCRARGSDLEIGKRELGARERERQAR